MARFTRVLFYQMSPFHISKGTDEYDLSASEISSDMLSSALAAIRAGEGKTTDIASFLSSFTLSSAFPYCSGHYFLPRLEGRINVEIEGLDENVYRKQLKHVKYIESQLWEKLVSSPEKVKIDSSQICGEYLLGGVDKNFQKPITYVTSQRVCVPREGQGESDPFYFEWCFVRSPKASERTIRQEPEAGIYCLLHCPDGQKAELLDLFTKLGEEGFGSDKNIGGGHFKAKEENLEMDSLPDCNAQVLLSSYIPTHEELQGICLEKSRYQIQERGGFMSGSSEEQFRHLRKKSVYVFHTGSVLCSDQALKGQIVNLAPVWNDKKMHPVYRSGRAFSVGIKI
nr:hypothetical protein [uncultured Prevotella sp.]